MLEVGICCPELEVAMYTVDQPYFVPLNRSRGTRRTSATKASGPRTAASRCFSRPETGKFAHGQRQTSNVVSDTPLSGPDTANTATTSLAGRETPSRRPWTAAATSATAPSSLRRRPRSRTSAACLLPSMRMPMDVSSLVLRGKADKYYSVLTLRTWQGCKSSPGSAVWLEREDGVTNRLSYFLYGGM